MRLTKIDDYKKYSETIFTVEQKDIIDKLICLLKTEKTENK